MELVAFTLSAVVENRCFLHSIVLDKRQDILRAFLFLPLFAQIL